MRVAFFGGSFNPPHVGHVLVAAYARSMGFDAVLVAPVAEHAFTKPLESFEHRLTMCRLAFDAISGVEISRIESELPHPNYTVRTLRALRLANPAWSLHLLIGSDVMTEADRWYHFDEIQELAPPFVIARSGASEYRAIGPALPDVSSTEVRRLLGRRKEGDARTGLQRCVPLAVLNYIDQEGLYEQPGGD